MSDQLSPDDVVNAIAASHDATEGVPMTDEEMRSAIVTLAEFAINSARANGAPEAAIVETAKLAARAAALIPGSPAHGCDGCDDSYDEEVLAIVDDIVPTSQTLSDANGDPDVTICGFCIYEHEDEPMPEPDPVTDARWAELQRQQAEDDESDAIDFTAGDAASRAGLVPGDTPADRDAIISGLGWSA